MQTQQAQSVLGEMKPSKAIVKLAIPATFPIFKKDFNNKVDNNNICIQRDDNTLEAKDYAYWMFIAALANLPAQSMNCAARAESSVRISSVAVITGAALNVVLDPVFMFSWGLGMGVEGASLATTVSQFVTFFILVGFYLSGRSVIKIRARSFKPTWGMVKTVTLIGIPTAIIQICLAVASSMTNVAIKPIADATELLTD